MTVRLDAALAARGLSRSRTQAARDIEAGLVTVDGVPVVKPSTPVADDAVLAVAGADHYVSRAAHKLIAALDAFPIRVDGRRCLDLGASTGGFTQVLRERGAAHVLAVDVGHGQLAASVAADPGVTVVEGFNVRYMTPAALAAASGDDRVPEVVVADLSFISLGLVLPAIATLVSAATDIVLLIKPQFEVGRTGVREGLVTDPAARADAVAGVLWAAWDLGLGTAGLIASPLAGTHGNREYLVHLRPIAAASVDRPAMPGNPSEWLRTIDELTGAA
ncbi:MULTISPECIES: TlyA family RNA methyltransferase [Microbacterium]|uniref:TlyA family rRNA (Cytidine-2'-O)-methyltransferase n=1 Tax=Microbacterium hominis TaxID=162426 RepID=A0A2K9DSA6_9MICO|nr:MULTISPECIES: TlyA family RNA methyltransferase [Microbacterium]AUG30136.1 TlyA family rRNA (cytidine-2'-O)-methyltransferase [Microbacterium hominis]